MGKEFGSLPEQITGWRLLRIDEIVDCIIFYNTRYRYTQKAMKDKAKPRNTAFYSCYKKDQLQRLIHQSIEFHNGLYEIEKKLIKKRQTIIGFGPGVLSRFVDIKANFPPSIAHLYEYPDRMRQGEED